MTVLEQQSAGRVGLSPEVTTAVEGSVFSKLYDAHLNLNEMQMLELAEQITAVTLFTYNSVRGTLPTPQLATGVTGCTLEAAIMSQVEMLVNRFTHLNDAWTEQDTFHLVGAVVEQIVARLKSRDYPFDPKGKLVLYDNNGQVVTEVDVSVGYCFLTMSPSQFASDVKAVLDRYQANWP